MVTTRVTRQARYRTLRPHREQASGFYWRGSDGFSNGTTAVSDSGTVRLSTAAVKMTSTNAVQSKFDVTPAAGQPPTNVLECDLYIDDTTKLALIGILVTSNNFTGWITTKLTPTNAPLKNGWNRIAFTPNDGYISGTGMAVGSWSGVSKVRFNCTSTGGQTVNVWVDNLRWVRARAAISLTFDDGRVSQHDYAMRVLDGYGWAGTLYLATNCVGDATFTPAGGGADWNGVTLPQLRTLHAHGWDIGAHTQSHPDLSTLTDVQQEAELLGAWTYLRDNGFIRSEGAHWATPYGKRDANTLVSSAKYYSTLRDASAASHQGYENHRLLGVESATKISPAELVDNRHRLRSQDIGSDASPTSLATFQGWVDTAIAGGYWLICTFHDVGPDGGWCSESRFLAYLDYLDGKRSQIDVLTLGQYFRTVKPLDARN